MSVTPATHVWCGVDQRVDDIRSRTSWKRCAAYVTLQVGDEEYSVTPETARDIARGLIQFAKVAEVINR